MITKTNSALLALTILCAACGQNGEKPYSVLETNKTDIISNYCDRAATAHERTRILNKKHSNAYGLIFNSETAEEAREKTTSRCMISTARLQKPIL